MKQAIDRQMCVVWVLGCLVLAFGGLAQATPLDDYVNAPDPEYTYGPTPANVITGTGYTANVWYMASGTWRSPSEVDRTLWEHWLVIIIPNTVSHTKAMMLIDGGSNTSTPPSSVESIMAQIAVATQSIVAYVKQIPNERIKFSDETDPRYIANGRTEDELIAYAWDKYKTTGDPTWLPRLPMTRAVARAMDTVQAEHPTITGFFVLGASKRGWTTWTTGIADPRAEVIAPMVIDIPNVEHSMQHHWDAYGYWADSIVDYVDMGIMDWMHTPEFRAMCDIIDPYENVEHLTMPKYIVNSTGDEFFLPDSSQFYWDALKGEKYLRYVPNTDHGIDDAAVTVQDLTAFYQSYLTGTARPQFSWTKEADGTLHVETVTAPTAVRLWQATNTTARNFRLDTIGAAWTSSVLSDTGGGVYVGQVAPPAQGWTAFLVELEFPSGGPYPFHFTTEVSVVPDTLPFRDVGGSGTIETVGTGTDAISVVHLAGTSYEMGYWYGRLLADQIAAMWTIAQGFGIPDAEFDAAIDAMWRSTYFDTTEWENELRGIADGCHDAGHPEVTFRAMQKIQMIPDMSELGCGLYALWGNATATGDLYQLRNLDWTMDAHFQDYPVVAIYTPAAGYGLRHATIGFAGNIGCGGGGMNEYGLAVSEIMGHFCDAESLNGIPFPILLRDVLSKETTLAGALARMSGATRTNQYHYCIADPAAVGAKGRLLFTSATRFDQYADESVVGHPCVSPDPFHTTLDDAIYWKRHDGGGNLNLYSAILARYGAIGDTEAIEIAQADGVAGTLLSIVYNNTQRKFWAAYANGTDPAHNQGYVAFDLSAWRRDSDGDGTPDDTDTDDDDDGMSDVDEGTGDPDLDGIPNYLDTDSDADEMPDEFEHLHGLDPYADDADSDLDGDGRSNLFEYLAGTPPDEFDPALPAAGALALVLAGSALCAASIALRRRALRRT